MYPFVSGKEYTRKDVLRIVGEQGRSYGEAAKLLGLDRQAVRSVWRRALGRIARSPKLQELTGIVPDPKA